MSAVGGSVESVSIRGRLFAVAADADVNMKTGGSDNAFEPNGDGLTGRIIKTRTGWMLSNIVLSIDHDRADLDFLDEVQEETEPVDITITYADETTFQARGTIIGEPEYSAQKSTAAVTLGGPGKASAQ